MNCPHLDAVSDSGFDYARGDDGDGDGDDHGHDYVGADGSASHAHPACVPANCQ